MEEFVKTFVVIATIGIFGLVVVGIVAKHNKLNDIEQRIEKLEGNK